MDCEFDACPEEKVCTMDVKVCPDGSTVSRDVEMDCSFPECPKYYWAQYLGENTKCEKTGDREAAGVSKEDCMMRAEEQGAKYMSWVDENGGVCFVSTSCDNPVVGTGWNWMVW